VKRGKFEQKARKGAGRYGWAKKGGYFNLSRKGLGGWMKGKANTGEMARIIYLRRADYCNLQCPLFFPGAIESKMYLTPLFSPFTWESACSHN